MELYLFRHGEKEKDGYFIGHTDVELTKYGRRENKKITKILKKLMPEKIFTSDLRRTFVSGGIPNKALREINFGLWEGLSWHEIEKKFPIEAHRYLTDPESFTFPEGESYTKCRARIIKWLYTIQRKKLSRIALVTHQGVIRVIVHHFTGKNFWKIRPTSGKPIKIKI